MTHDEIRAAIGADPALQALAAAGDTQGIADALSAGRTRIGEHYASARGVLERYPHGPLAGDELLAALEAFAATADPTARIVGRALHFLNTPEGLNIGAAATQGLIDALHAGGVLTQVQRDGLRTMATVPDPVSEWAVRCAIYADDGTLLI